MTFLAQGLRVGVLPHDGEVAFSITHKGMNVHMVKRVTDRAPTPYGCVIPIEMWDEMIRRYQAGEMRPLAAAPTGDTPQPKKRRRRRRPAIAQDGALPSQPSAAQRLSAASPGKIQMG